MKSILFSTFVCLIPLGVVAQESQPKPPRPTVEPAKPSVQPAVRTRRRAVVLPPSTGEARPAVAEATRTSDRAAPIVPGLSKNVTVTIRGTMQGIVTVDLELTGCGPQFVTDFNIEQAPDSNLPAPIMTISLLLTEIEDGFHADYSLGARIAIATEIGQGPAPSTRIEFRELILKGAARVKLGEPVVVSKIAGKALELTVSEVK